MNPILIKIEESVRYDRIAIAEVKYHDLTLSLNVRVTRDRKAIFIEMPMIQRGQSFYHLCRWESKDISDAFQRSIIAQIHQQAPDLMRLIDLPMFREELRKYQESRIPKVIVENEKPKARNQSKFAKVKNVF